MKGFQKALFVSLVALCLLCGVTSISAAQEAGEFVPVGTEIEVVSVGEPWVGPGTPWVFWNNNWYYNGILYAFYGALGWWPNGYYANNIIVRNDIWYGPRWHNWYRGHPIYWNNFRRHYGRGHRWHHGYRGHDAWKGYRGHGRHGHNLTRGDYRGRHDYGRNLLGGRGRNLKRGSRSGIGGHYVH